MRFQIVIVGKCSVAEKALKQPHAFVKKEIDIWYALDKKELTEKLNRHAAALILLPVEWLDIAEELRDCIQPVRLLAYGECEQRCSDIIALGGDNYISLATTIDTINRKFHFQFCEGLFRAVLLRIDYADQSRELFDWFYMFDEIVVAEMTAALEEICYDVYVEFRMNGPMY